MNQHLQEIEKALTKYNLKISRAHLQSLIKKIDSTQQYFPVNEQHALVIKLITDWESKKNEKITTAISESCNKKGIPCITTFGILSVDWPGFSDTCLGIFHEMGWNIYFLKGLSMTLGEEEVGIILIGIRTGEEKLHKRMVEQSQTILHKIHQAGVGTHAKAFLLTEEIRKLEIYSQVITYIEHNYHGEDLAQIIGLTGEAVKYFAARSRNYIENRKIKDIADQIIRNYTFIKATHQTGNVTKIDISDFETNTEGTFTGVTLVGPAHLLNLEDCLKTIEFTSPGFILKHNREFTTEQGISLYRIEFVNSSGKPLNEADQNRLKKSFSTLVLNKRRDKAQWIEAVGGFEQYARAIIPLLVKEAQTSCKTQVYLSLGHSTDLYLEFKVIVVVPTASRSKEGLVNRTVNSLQTDKRISILSVKPAKTFGSTNVFILDLRVDLTDIEDTESVYRTIKEKIYDSLGEFRDFDEGMRTIDVSNMKSVRQRLKGIPKNLIRELYYSIEDFFRVSASGHEILAHIRIALSMINTVEKKKKPLLVISRQIVTRSPSGRYIPAATLVCISYPHDRNLLPAILEILDPFEVTLSRIERTGYDILICRITKNDRALDEKERKQLLGVINKQSATDRDIY